MPEDAVDQSARSSVAWLSRALQRSEETFDKQASGTLTVRVPEFECFNDVFDATDASRELNAMILAAISVIKSVVVKTFATSPPPEPKQMFQNVLGRHSTP